jgi:Zn-finger protein
MKPKGKDCNYYPCHDGIIEEEYQCEFCFCPIYPCNIEKTGGKIISGRDGSQIWDCSDCIIVHEKENFNKIKKGLHNIIQEISNGI